MRWKKKGGRFDAPLHIRFLDAEMWVDLGAERLIAAEKNGVFFIAAKSTPQRLGTRAG